jgi:hypothetical protein
MIESFGGRDGQKGKKNLVIMQMEITASLHLLSLTSFQTFSNF